MAKKQQNDESGFDELLNEMAESKIKEITNDEVMQLFEKLEKKLSELELYKRSINKPYRLAYYLRKQVEILRLNFKRNQ
jgi:Txe/YoeB family toxin of Txe-Axe toxin-antitoxin module